MPARARRLCVLGCDGGYPGPGGAGSGYLVESGETVVLVDAGPGTFANLQQLSDPGLIDAVVLSHEHPDHWSDLESFAVWLLQVGPGRPVTIHAPPGLRQRSYFADSPVFAFAEIAPENTLSIGSLHIRFSTTDHGPPTRAMRFDDPAGPALAYSADTGPGWSVGSFGPGIGTFLCEATHLRDGEGHSQHLSGRQAGAMAREAGVDRLIITHRSPTVSAGAVVDEATAAFGRPVEQAAVGAAFDW